MIAGGPISSLFLRTAMVPLQVAYFIVGMLVLGICSIVGVSRGADDKAAVLREAAQDPAWSSHARVRKIIEDALRSAAPKN